MERITKPTNDYQKIIDAEKDSPAWNKERRYAAKEVGNALGDKVARITASYETTGWTDCGCGSGFESGTVLDPFVGSGTTLLEALRQKKNGIGIEINPEYVKLIKKRLLGDEHQSTLVPDVVKVIN